MSKPNGISYGVRPEDDGSDMDVSSDDEGLHMYQSLPNLHQEQVQHASREKQQSLSISSSPRSSSSRLATDANCWTAFVDKVAQHQTPIAIRDGPSDTESTSSFHTAPNSPIDWALDDDHDADMDRQHPPDIINELVSKQDTLAQELERINNEEKRVARLLKAKKAELEAIRVRQLELQVRKSIQKNRKAVITPAKSKKGKEKASIDEHYRSCTSSDEEDTQQPPRKAKAIINPISGRPEKQPVEETARTEPEVDIAEAQEAQVKAEEDKTEKIDESQAERATMYRDLEESRAPISANNKPYIFNLAKQNKHTLQAIRHSQTLGHTSVGQMKMFLCDLYDKFLENGKLSRIQRVHYKELVRQVSRYDAFGDDHIPGRAIPKKAKKAGEKVQPVERRMLPDEFYGHPKKLNFRNLSVDRGKLLDALSCSEVSSPFILVQAKILLAKRPTDIKLSEFEGVVGPDGEVVDREELMMHMGNRRINRLLTLYKEVRSAHMPYQEARAPPMPMGQRTRHEYYLAQRQLQESMMRETGTISPEPSTAENPLVSDNSTDALNSVMVSLAPSSREVDAKPITTITYVPNETSFIRSILPGGREPSSLNNQPKAAQKAKAAQKSKLPPQPKVSKPSNAKFAQKPKAAQKPKLPPQPKVSKASNAKSASSSKASTKNHTQAPASAQIPTIPNKNGNLSPPKPPNKPSLSASNTLSSFTSSTTNTDTLHQQPSASHIPPPQQNKTSTFQPYRSALDSLGVTRSADVQLMKSGILCRAESDGGVCNDKSCRHTHFTDFIHK